MAQWRTASSPPASSSSSRVALYEYGTYIKRRRHDRGVVGEVPSWSREMRPGDWPPRSANHKATPLHNQPPYGYDIIITREVYYWSSAERSPTTALLSLLASPSPPRGAHPYPGAARAHPRRGYYPLPPPSGTPSTPLQNYEDQYARRWFRRRYSLLGLLAARISADLSHPRRSSSFFPSLTCFNLYFSFFFPLFFLPPRALSSFFTRVRTPRDFSRA